MSSNASTEKPTGAGERPITTSSQDDEWEFVNEKEIQPSDDQFKKEDDLEKSNEESKKEMSDEERKRELNKAKWEGMQQQSGGVYPRREVKVPSYPKFMGDW